MRKRKLKLTIHPLFFVCGIFFTVFGGLFMFLLYTIVALIHECGHAFCASKMGFELKKIVLMPYGAIVKGNTDGINSKDEIILCLSGPFLNFIVAIFFISLWWFFPETYTYTDTAVFASLSVGAINLLPFYPLDGGRILFRLLCLKIKTNKVILICKIINVIFFIVIGFAFIIMPKSISSVSMLIFAFLTLIGVFSSQNLKYTKINFSTETKLGRGLEVKQVAVSSKTKIKSLVNFLQKDKYLQLNIFKDSKLLCVISQDQLYSIFEKADIYDEISLYIH